MISTGSQRGEIPPFVVMDVMRAAATREYMGDTVLHLDVGQPSTGAPTKALEAVGHALNDEVLGYTMALGRDALRERISRHYTDFYGLSVDPSRVAVTNGSSGGFVLAFLAAFDVGARIAVAEPGYPCYRNALTALGIHPVGIPVDAATRYQLVSKHLEDLREPVQGVILASPANPTGTIVSRADLVKLIGHCRAHGIRVISDEIYHGIEFGVPRVTVASLDDDAIVVNSFSKYFSMTGWRIGWMIAPAKLMRKIERLAQNLYIAAPTVSQVAATAAFDCYEELNRHVATYAENREILLSELPAIGLTRLAPPDGAFYLYAHLDELTSESSLEFCARLLRETGIAVAPGIDFDPDRGRATIRLSFSGSTLTISSAAKSLRAWLRR